MSRLKIDGRYKTGVRSFRISQVLTPKGGKAVEFDAQVVCFYPIDQQEYLAKENSGEAKFQTFKDVYGMELFGTALKAATHPPCFGPKGSGAPEWLLRPIFNYEIPAFKDAQLSSSFRASD